VARQRVRTWRLSQPGSECQTDCRQMKRSTDRILTTHVGSLIRTPEIIRGMQAAALKKPYDQTKLAADVAAGIHDVVRQQVAVGIDIVNDGEYGRRGFVSYVHERLGGLEPRPLDPNEPTWGAQAERLEFPGFFEQYASKVRYDWMLPEISMDEIAPPENTEVFNLKGPIKYVGQDAVQRDITLLADATRGVDVADVFVTAVTPMSRKNDYRVEEFYPSQEAYLYAMADAMHEEYRAITDAGFILQLDYAALNPQAMTMIGKKNATAEEMDRARELSIEIVNHALQGIPEEQVRYHHCWGSDNRPHTTDTALTSIVGQMLKLKVQAYGIEAANPRHEHEWMVWKDVRLPEGKILFPGLISQSTNVVEHPELVAWRIKNFASVVGKENVIASVDCGFSQWWDAIRVHPTVQWAKLKALADGAALASRELWGH
jgi:5-methyltetrahydropteroyltriglutamate--homocysteine methyltransferase